VVKEGVKGEKPVAAMAAMHGGAIAAALRNRRNREQQDHLDFYIENESASSAAFRTRKIEGIIQTKMDSTTVALDNVRRKALKHEKQVEGLLAKVDERLARGTHYTNLLAITTFFVLYVVVLFLQRDATLAYSVEASYLDTIIRALPDTGYINSEQDLYDWLQSDIIERVFVDPACGDGICAIPDEYPGFGRFGCQRDCGRYSKTSTITVNLLPYLNYTQDQSDILDPTNTWWDLENQVMQGSTNPEYRFNVYSHTMGEFLLAEDTKVIDEPVVIEVPDGPLTLHLYQQKKMSTLISPNDIYKFTFMDGATLPQRNSSSDFAYGDKREALAAQALIQKQTIDSCFSVPPSDLTDNQLTLCLENPIQDFYFKGMASYGLKGDVKTSNGSKATAVLADVPFCKIYPLGHQGLLNASNKQLAVDNSIPCSVGARRRRSQMTRTSASAEKGTGGGEGGRRLLQAPGACTRHEDCDPNIFDKFTGAPGQFCTIFGYCDACSFCQVDQEDSIDGVCPQEPCPGSGGFPECIDAQAIMKEWECPATYDFEVYKFASKGTPVTVKPPPKDNIRRVTPFNRLVGAVVLTQSRQATGDCRKIANDDVKAFAAGMRCLKKGRDTAPFGRDPVLMPTSSIYDGKLAPEEFYQDSERFRTKIEVEKADGTVVLEDVLTTAIPFFPHGYDQQTGQEKAKDKMFRKRSQHEKFNVYLDSRVTETQAKRMLAFMNEGSFIDGFTKQIDVQMVTFNTNVNLFASLIFTFYWETGGGITWDFKLQTVFVDIYRGAKGQAQLILEIVCVIFLAANCVYEMRDIFIGIRVMKPLQYFMDPMNVFDWFHLIMMWVGWILWALYYQRASTFEMNAAYPVLADPGAKARLFVTDAENEKIFLEFVHEIQSASDALAQYVAVSSICVLLFVIRVLKNLDFQPRMGLVTRTLASATSDLLHFAFLFFIVFFGYAMVGHLLFGHQFEWMKNPGDACVFLFFQLLAFDPTQFWTEMTHAAPAWAFHLFLWSFLLIVFFILFNVLLAILIDAYAMVKAETPEDSESFPGEMKAVMADRLLDMFVSEDKRISDPKFKERLEAHKNGLPSTDVLRDALLTSTAPPDPICLPGGITIDAKVLRQLVKEPDLEGDNRRRSSIRIYDGGGALEEAGEDGEWDGEEEEMVNDVVERYSKLSILDSDKLEQDTLSILQVEHLKRELAMYRCAQRLHDTMSAVEGSIDKLALEHLPPEERTVQDDLLAIQPNVGQGGDKRKRERVRGIVRVTVVEAKKLPKMDILRSVDPYCLVFLTERIGESTTGEVTFRTEEKKADRNPVWNADFELPIMRNSTALTIAMFDKVQDRHRHRRGQRHTESHTHRHTKTHTTHTDTHDTHTDTLTE